MSKLKCLGIRALLLDCLKKKDIFVPLVSIIVPCYNEQNTISLLLEALYQQTFPRSEIEVIISDGLSTDRTREQIANFQRQHSDLCLQVVDNEKGTIPAGLNRALQAAHGQFVVRLDAHSKPRPDYVARCLDALESGLGDNVGGVWEIHSGGEGGIARAIAAAASHPLAVGDAHYRHARQARVVDTVPFGAYRLTLIERIGLYDETLLTNEDYEFNTRIRQSGGTVWLDPAIRSTYFARATLAALASQYWRYGFWKARMLRRYPESLRWRQALPPLFVLSLLVFGLLSLWALPARLLLILECVLYCLVLLAVGFQVSMKKKDPALIIGVPLAIAVMHLTWGSAFLWSLIFKRES
jgi:succinoglycan biosynthesis protein ExoA